MFLYSNKRVANLAQLLLANIVLYCSAELVAAQEGTASESCFPRISYAITLAETLGQVKQASGVEVRGNLMEIYVNPNSGTWTLVLVLPRGLACEIGSGIDFGLEPHPHGV